jgi:aromatic-L-amino-acid decarboxylase
MTLGIGRDNVVRVPVDGVFRMQVDALAAAIEADRAAGHTPIAIVATLGTTSSTSMDPVREIADIAEREGLWLHVDAAYAGVVALLPERRGDFDGWERADSIVVNPHKWLFTPIDASLLLTRRMSSLRDAFSLVPPHQDVVGAGVDLVGQGLATGRRFAHLEEESRGEDALAVEAIEVDGLDAGQLGDRRHGSIDTSFACCSVPR